jgi:hypothetical protein
MFPTLTGSFGTAVVPFYFYLSRTQVGKKLFTTKLRVIYNVVTMASTPKASLDWAPDYNVDVKQWPRRPDNFYKSPNKAFFSASCMTSWTASKVSNIASL